jgi:hypothetical protein
MFGIEHDLTQNLGMKPWTQAHSHHVGASYCRCHAGDASFMCRKALFIGAERPAIHRHAWEQCDILCSCVLMFMYLFVKTPAGSVSRFSFLRDTVASQGSFPSSS